MNLQQLHYLSVLAQTENYTQAAKLLHITQPSLSYAISTLEAQIGIELFKKEGRNVKLTKAGQIFVSESSPALEILNRAIERAKESDNEQSLVKIAALRVLQTRWLPNQIRNFLASYTTQSSEPKFEFGTGTGFSLKMIEMLRNEEIDICFCSKIDNQEDIDYFPVVEQKLVLITPKDHPLANKTSINLSETLDYKQITFAPNTGLYFEIEKLFSICGKSPESMYTVEEDVSVAGMVAAGFGIAVVPRMQILDHLPVSVIPIEFPNWHRLIYMATLKKHYQNQTSQAFINYIKENIVLELHH